MTDQLTVWLTDKKHSIEDHLFEFTLSFRERVIFGPTSCDSRTIELGNAIHKADYRFTMNIGTKSKKTVEGHTRYISVKSYGRILVDRLPTHDNMCCLIVAINAVYVGLDQY